RLALPARGLRTVRRPSADLRIAARRGLSPLVPALWRAVSCLSRGAERPETINRRLEPELSSPCHTVGEVPLRFESPLLHRDRPCAGGADSRNWPGAFCPVNQPAGTKVTSDAWPRPAPRQ